MQRRRCSLSATPSQRVSPKGNGIGTFSALHRAPRTQEDKYDGLAKYVPDFCRSCEKCQKFRHHRTPRAPMVPLPVVAEPFSRIAMDIVGPLPRSRSGNRYVLVLCDYGTRYPEAVALKSIDAVTVAEELMKIFSRVGLPWEILTATESLVRSQRPREVIRAGRSSVSTSADYTFKTHCPVAGPI